MAAPSWTRRVVDVRGDTRGGSAVLRFGDDGRLRHEKTVQIPDATDALISNGDAYVYAVTRGSLVVFERDGETGTLTEAGSQALSDSFVNSAYAGVAISHDDAYLFAFNDSGFGNEVVVFELSTDPASPQVLHSFRSTSTRLAGECRLQVCGRERQHPASACSRWIGPGPAVERAVRHTQADRYCQGR